MGDRDERSDGAIFDIAVFVRVFYAILRRCGHYSSTQETKPTHQEYLLITLPPFFLYPCFFYRAFFGELSFSPFWFSKEERKVMRMAHLKKNTQRWTIAVQISQMVSTMLFEASSVSLAFSFVCAVSILSFFF